jgi:hypothetical protein
MLLARAPSAFRFKDGQQATSAFITGWCAGGVFELGSLDGFYSFKTTPAVYKGSLLTCSAEDEWLWWRGARSDVLATRGWTADLFERVLPPTVLGDVVYFGTWAADAATGEILWRLPVGVRFGAVPVDRMVIVVDEGGGLRAFRGRLTK